MTEAEWLAGVRAGQLLIYLEHRSTARKLRLLAIECIRVLAEDLDDPHLQRGLHFVEENIGRQFRGLRHRRNLHSEVTRIVRERTARRDGAGDALGRARRIIALIAASSLRTLLGREPWQATYECVGDISGAVAWRACVAHGSTEPSAYRDVGMKARARQDALASRWVRDIFGNPFRPVAFSPEWRTETAVSLARQMYESRDFGAMPILADALQDAGCDDEDILSHCRNTPLPHVRGCWVEDLVLGKE